VGVTAAESGTYTDFAQINSGGLREDGSDGVNEVTYLLLDVIEEMRLVQPSSSIQVSKKNPDRFVKRAARIIRTGFGQPSVFNCDLIVQELIRRASRSPTPATGRLQRLRRGRRLRQGGLHPHRLFQPAQGAGTDAAQRRGPRTGKQIGLDRRPRAVRQFRAALRGLRRQLGHLIDVKMRGNQVIERLYATYMPAPFLSILIDDCIARGRDYHDGGARYNTNYIQGVGLGTMTDALAAIKHHVFEQKSLSMPDCWPHWTTDFEGCERLRQTL
jgi:trans-4-hydroxy-L-proline dehydratase